MGKLLLLPVLIFISFSAIAQQYSEPFDFYIYSFEEAGGLFGIFQYFDQMESGELKDEKAYEYFLTQGLTTNSVAGLFTEAYFRETENPDVRAYTLDYLSKIDATPSTIAIQRRYESERKSLSHSGKETYHMVHKDDLYDENIKFHNVTSIHLFDGELAAFVPMSDWLPMQFTNNETGETDNNRITLMTGGQTTAMNIRYERKELQAIPRIGSIHDPENYVFELTDESVITKNNADLTVLSINKSQENPFTFTLTLYDFIEMVEYEIHYFYNISHINMNYEIWDHLKAIVLYTSFLSYLEK